MKRVLADFWDGMSPWGPKESNVECDEPTASAVPEYDEGSVVKAEVEDLEAEIADIKEKLPPSEIKNARLHGKKAFSALEGYTSNTEQKMLNDILNEDVNSENVLEFLRGYQSKTPPVAKQILPIQIPSPAEMYGPNSFFEQLRTEWDYPEKQELMNKVVSDLHAFVEERLGEDNPIAKELAVIQLSAEFGEQETKQLDEIVAMLLKQFMN
jgi:hypothetical protein